MTAQSRPRAGSSALAPGVTIFSEDPGDGWLRWRVRSSAMIDGKQRLRSWSPVRIGLADAIRQAAAYRWEHHPEAAESEAALLNACWEAIPRETLDALRDAGAKVKRP